MNYACDQCGVREATYFHPYVTNGNPGSYCDVCWKNDTELIEFMGETALYRIVVGKGNECWLVFLTNPKPSSWTVLAARSTLEEAKALANQIRAEIAS